MSRTFIFPLVAATLGLVSCATVSNVGKNSLAFVRKTSEATTSKVSELAELAADKIQPAGVKVVEVREKDLKKLPTGQEKALAYENSHKRGFWFFGGPVDFKEPTLPEAGGEMDGSLLPPKAP
ncbi:MAG: hypothetical protein ABIS50_20015 [Luteolibacter sp.]|uniref:hypothetical protein n=1 Tax=Luteolibacter sp. TaxID=1962973 RepID=UPI003264DBBD